MCPTIPNGNPPGRAQDPEYLFNDDQRVDYLESVGMALLRAGWSLDLPNSRGRSVRALLQEAQSVAKVREEAHAWHFQGFNKLRSSPIVALTSLIVLEVSACCHLLGSMVSTGRWSAHENACMPSCAVTPMALDPGP